MPTTRDKVEQWSLAYFILKHYVDLGFHFYFRTTVSGLNSLPTDKTLIFAPNHQNALMDALAVLCVRTWQPVFLARADIFSKPLLSKILTFIKIMPVYRMRDGYGNLQKNDEIFNKTIDVLKNKNGLVILPEGNHGDQKRLRPLKKGIARIALQAEEACDESLDIQIVPVGLDYTDYIKVGSGLHIRFGTPMGVAPFMKIYKENSAKAYNMLISNLEKGIKAEMVDIEDEKYYAVYKVIIDGFTTDYLRRMKLPQNHPNAVDAQQIIIERINNFKKELDDDFLLLAADALEYRLLLNRRGLKPTLFPMSQSEATAIVPIMLSLLVLLPLFIYSFINIMLPVGISKMISKKFLDLQFISSVRFTLGLLLTPLFHLIQIIVFAVISGSFIYTLVYAITLPLCFYVFFEWKKWATLIGHRFREIYFKTVKSKRSKRLYELHESIKNQLWKIINFKDDSEFHRVN